MEEQPVRRRTAVKVIAENRAAQAFHGNPQLVGFAGLRLQYEQPQIRGDTLAVKPRYRRIGAVAARQLPCAAARFFHPALDQPLFFRRPAVAECQIGFPHGFGGKLLRQFRCRLSVQSKQQHTAGRLVQTVRQLKAGNV